MHGRPRKAPTQEEQDASSLKALKLRDLQSQVLHFHHNKIYTKEAIEISAKLLESNPEHYTGWNYRKLAVQYLLDQESDTGAQSESIQSIFADELRLVENALKRNFKSYGAWHHRKWVLSKGHSSSDWELRLLEKFQKLDSRNFHAWNYRRFITALKKIPDEEELQYTTRMIDDNFSNYSAWHNRSMLLSNLLEKGGKGYDEKDNVLIEEFEFVRNALFTDPDDQSGWFYHLWLLDQTLKREPIFLSSWPSDGSHLNLSIDSHLNGQQPLPTICFQSKERLVPLILYFSEQVEGVSSSTVTVEFDYDAGNDLIWRPLSANTTGFSQAWLTYIKFPNDPLEACPVKVTIAQFPGIISLSGVPCTQSSSISFTVCVPSKDREHSDVQTKYKISWNEENFKACVAQSQEAELLHSLCKLDITKGGKPTTPNRSMETVSNEITHCQELLSITNCKIGKLTLARLLMAHNTLISHGCPDGRVEAHYEDILALYHDLMKMDPPHICYYEDEYSLVLLKQVTSNIETILKHCYQYQESSSPATSPYLCLRLTGVSLSRISSMEQLLWVQMLDLSHNKLHSLEGLEALQLLSCLKLSNNRFRSFTALEPLKMLKSLEVLDISYNEIGAHTVDPRRYLCCSPLNHAAGNDWQFKKFTDGETGLIYLWDAYLLFKDLNLTQLDIKGNAVVDERLQAFLFKLMPALKWLDDNFEEKGGKTKIPKLKLVAEMSNSENEEELQQPPSHHPSAPPHESFDISTTVDPSYVISLIRKLLPSDTKSDEYAIGSGLIHEEPKPEGGKDDVEKLPENGGEAEAMDSSGNYGKLDGQEQGCDYQNESGSAGEQTWEEYGCILWDLAASEDHSQFMVQNLILEVLLANLMASPSSRITEISLGIIGNLACHESSRRQIASTNGLVAAIVEQLLLDDVPCLCEAFRVLSLCLQGGEGVTWAEALQSEQILSRILWIAENALNPLLIERSVGLLLAVLESQQELAAILLPPLLKLGLSSLLVKLLAFEMSKLKGERIPERYSVLDFILRAIEALSTLDDYSEEICLNNELVQLVKELIKLPDKFEIASSCVTAAVLMANILTDATNLASELSLDLNFLQGLFDVFPFASDDTEAQSAIWSTVAKILMVQEREMSPSDFHFLVSILASKLDLIEDELLSHPLDHQEHKTSDTADTKSDSRLIAMKGISNILRRWKSLDDSVKNTSSMEDYNISEDDVDKLLDHCSKSFRHNAG